MGRITLRDVGMYGVVKDIPGYELPPEVWTDARNVSFLNKQVVKSYDELTVFGATAAVPYYLFSCPDPTTAFWAYTDLQRFYSTSSGAHTDITRLSGPYTGNIDSRWNGAWLNGVMILNNGVDMPQQWAPIGAAIRLIDLANWNVNWRATVIRRFQNFLIAMDVTKLGVRYPTMVKWSHPADPGNVPVSWDEADPTRIAGELPLSETPGTVIDGCELGPSFLVYKNDGIIRLDRIQTNDIFARRPISLITGIMAQECAKEFQPGKQAFLSHEADVLVTDGNTMVSVLDRKNQKWLEKRIAGNRDHCLMTVNTDTREVYVAYPTDESSPYCDELAVWNWVDGTWSFKELSQTLDLKMGMYEQSSVSDTWDSDNNTWDSDNTTWDERLSVPQSHKVLGAFPIDDSIRQVNSSATINDSTRVSSYERIGLSLVGQARDGSPRVDPNAVKLVTELWPIMDSSGPMILDCYVGAQDRPDGPISWDGPFPFDPTTMDHVEPFIEGKYIATKFESDSPVDWSMSGYGLQVEVVGEYL